MKKQTLALIFCFTALFTSAQLLSLHKEYFIKLSNGKTMSFQAFPALKIADAKTEPSQPFSGVKKQNTNKINTLLKADSLVFESFNPDDKKQVWVIEFLTTLNGIIDNNRNFDFRGEVDDRTSYFTIRNKFSGKYLTRTSKIYKDNTTQVLLAPLSQNGNDENQQWS